ncbi:unnamed protein product [Didymodactylos carnosus]|nr:unnamed protein product [Didymodactylos carnosus]CAF4123904.1 unnamed protein product [Didymodactylos carnosus]
MGNVSSHDSYSAYRIVCNQLHQGVAAVFTGYLTPALEHVGSLTSLLHIPFFISSSDRQTKVDIYNLNVYPHYTTTSLAFNDLIKFQEWDELTIIIEHAENLLYLQDLFRLPVETPTMKVTVRQLRDKPEKWLPLLKQLQESGVSKFLVDISTEQLRNFFEQAKIAGLVGPYYHFVLTSMDISTIDWNKMFFTLVNVTGLRIFNAKDQAIKEFFNVNQSILLTHNESSIRTSTALMYDSVYFFARALIEYVKQNELYIRQLSCDAEEQWDIYGFKFASFLKRFEVNGITGIIKFDENGLRTKDLKFDVIDLADDGVQKIGTWTSSYDCVRLNIQRNYTKDFEIRKHEIENQNLRVITIIEPPYVMLNNSSSSYTNETKDFFGFCIDILKELSIRLNFTYEISVVADGTFGKRNDSGKWNGIIGELVARRADLGLAGLTITYQREQVIDFTKPFLTLGINILYKKPQKKAPNLFSFLAPLSVEVWLYMIVAYFVVSFILYIVAHLSPYEWRNTRPCRRRNIELENQFTLLNSLWFIIGNLMQQAAFLTVQRMQTPIEHAEDLARQTEIAYGVQRGGSTENFFRESKLATYERMWTFISGNYERVTVPSSLAGIEKVKKENYAFLIESTTSEYNIMRDCNLTSIGGLLDSKGLLLMLSISGI